MLPYKCAYSSAVIDGTYINIGLPWHRKSSDQYTEIDWQLPRLLLVSECNPRVRGSAALLCQNRSRCCQRLERIWSQQVTASVPLSRESFSPSTSTLAVYLSLLHKEQTSPFHTSEIVSTAFVHGRAARVNGLNGCVRIDGYRIRPFCVEYQYGVHTTSRWYAEKTYQSERIFHISYDIRRW